MKIIVLVLFLVLLAHPVFSKSFKTTSTEKCLQHTCFPLKREIEKQTIPLLGAGLLEFWRMDVYTAGFYSGMPAGEPHTNLAKYPMLLSLHYHRYLKNKWIVEAAEKSLKKNSQVTYSNIEAQVNQIGKAYVDVDHGDVYELSYFPQKGTTLLLNGKELVTIPGEEFAGAYFGIWLSESPINQKLKEHLLGQRS